MSEGMLSARPGCFYAQRTADVDAVEDSRLLCINQNDLKILRRCYPRIAARVANNLNEILTNRLVNATQRLT